MKQNLFSARRPRRSFAALIAALALVVTGSTYAAAPSTTRAKSAATNAATTPIRAAFYYGWYPETENWASQYMPTLGHYNSSDTSTIDTQISQAQGAGLDAFITSWWGRGTLTARRLPIELTEAAKLGFHLTPYYEPEAVDDPTQAAVASDLTYLDGLATTYASSWLHVNGKPVIFVYNAEDVDQAGGCATVAKWTAANAGRFYLDMKVFPNYQLCADQPDSWHQYAPAATTQDFAPDSVTVAPGFYKYDEAAPRLVRDLPAFTAALQAQVASGAQWDLISTWNEWGEGTSVEPSTAWGTSYLDAMASVYNPTATSPPLSLTATDTADAYVDSADPTTNYGTATSLEEDAAGPATTVSYVTFTVSGYTGPVTASLRLWSDVAGRTPTQVYTTTSGWSEAGIDWANRPGLGAEVGTTGALVAGAYTTTNVSLAVTGNGQVSFALTTAATSTRTSDSREGTNPPQLVLTPAVGSGTTTAAVTGLAL